MSNSVLYDNDANTTLIIDDWRKVQKSFCIYGEVALLSFFPHPIFSSLLLFSPLLLSSHGGGEVRGRCVGWGAPTGTRLHPECHPPHATPSLWETHSAQTHQTRHSHRAQSAACSAFVCVCESELFKDPGEEWDVLSRFQGNRWAAWAFQILPLNWSWRMDGWMDREEWMEMDDMNRALIKCVCVIWYHRSQQPHDACTARAIDAMLVLCRKLLMSQVLLRTQSLQILLL